MLCCNFAVAFLALLALLLALLQQSVARRAEILAVVVAQRQKLALFELSAFGKPTCMMVRTHIKTEEEKKRT